MIKCFICGRGFNFLPSHLRRAHGVTAQQYREAYDIPQGEPLASMSRDAQIIATATDHAGQAWDVRERRPTAHGFDVLIGWPQSEPRGKGGRGVAVILTAELASYLAETRQRDIDLPIGLTAAKRLRRELGVSWSWDAWWADRADDLRSMTLTDFCARHGCSLGAASQRRAAALGDKATAK